MYLFQLHLYWNQTNVSMGAQKKVPILVLSLVFIDLVRYIVGLYCFKSLI